MIHETGFHYVEPYQPDSLHPLNDFGTIAISGRETVAVSDDYSEKWHYTISDNTALAGLIGKPLNHEPQQYHDRAEQARRNNLASSFPDHLPRLAYCSNSLPDGIRLREQKIALAHRFISLNGPSVFEWLSFDVDKPGSYFAADDANLPPPNVAMVNPKNGHAHLSYLLATPVAKHSLARIKPLEYFASVQRGMTNRLGADKQYCGLIVKNPVHEDWSVEWRRDAPYSLDELDDALFDRDKRFDPKPEAQWGAGRNVTTFDELRTFAYREVLKFKRNGASAAEFQDRLEKVALGINRQFVTPLSFSEIRATVKSVAKWTWRRFSPEQFSRIQRARVNMRWAGKKIAEAEKPWLAIGISRRTYYRQKAANSQHGACA